MLQNRTPIGGASSFPQDMGRHGNGINAEWSQAPLQGSKPYNPLGKQDFHGSKPHVPPGLNGESSCQGVYGPYNQPIHENNLMNKQFNANYYNIHTPEHQEDSQRQMGGCRNHGEIHFDRGKNKGLETFDGKAGDYRFWRRRMTNYIANEESSYGELIEWARSQKETITENIEVSNAEAAKFGLDVRQFSRKLYNLLCSWLGKTMDGRIDRAKGSGLELWRSLSDEFDSQAGEMLNAKMQLYQHPVRARTIDELESRFNEWEQLEVELGAGGQDFAVPT